MRDLTADQRGVLRGGGWAILLAMLGTFQPIYGFRPNGSGRRSAGDGRPARLCAQVGDSDPALARRLRAACQPRPLQLPRGHRWLGVQPSDLSHRREPSCVAELAGADWPGGGRALGAGRHPRRARTRADPDPGDALRGRSDLVCARICQRRARTGRRHGLDGRAHHRRAPIGRWPAVAERTHSELPILQWAQGSPETPKFRDSAKMGIAPAAACLKSQSRKH